MPRCSRLAFVFLLLVPAVSAGQDASRKDACDAACAEGRRLLDASEYDAALMAYGTWGDRMGKELRERADRAEPEEALALRRAWLDHFPFGRLNWSIPEHVWDPVAFAWLEAVEARGPPEEEEIRQSLAARDLYRQLAAARKAREYDRTASLAARILEEYPRSLFAAPAVLSLAVAKHGPPLTAADYDAWLARMDGTTDRARLLVRMARAKELDGAAAAAAYRRIRETTALAYERRRALLYEARALDIEDPAKARRLFADFLAGYPGVFERQEARLGILRTFLRFGESRAALAAFRELEKEEPEGTDLSAELFAVADGWFVQMEWKRSLAILEEIAERYPAGAVVAKAWLGMAEVHAKLGDEARMVAAWERAAELPGVDTHSGVMDASNTVNRAIESLGEHWMAKGDYAEALSWWLRWKPWSWCGNCAEGMRSRRVTRIATCRQELGRSDEAIAGLEARALGTGWPAPGVSILYADLMLERGRRAELEAKVAEAGVEPLVTYLAMIRAAEAEDAEMLWTHLGDRLPGPEERDWELRRAYDLLLSIPQPTKILARGRLRSGEGSVLTQAVSLLSRLKDDESVPIFRERIAAERISRSLRGYFLALVQMGTERAVALVREYAESGTPVQRKAAERALRYLDD